MEGSRLIVCWFLVETHNRDRFLNEAETEVSEFFIAIVLLSSTFHILNEIQLVRYDAEEMNI